MSEDLFQQKEKEISDLKLQVEEKDKAIEGLNKTVDELNEKLSSLTTEKKSELESLEEVTFQKKKYSWLKTKFRLPGDHNIYTAEQAATESGKKDGLIAKILAIKGQSILAEVS